MLGQLLTSHISIMALGIRKHGLLLSDRHAEVQKIFESSRWTCHVCSIRIPEFMEIDHTAGHKRSAGGLKPICQFCHNLKHPLWAASQDRIIPVFAPDLTQQEINRLAWMVVAYRGQEGVDVSQVQTDMENRHKQFIDIITVDRNSLVPIINPGRAEPFLEAVLSFAQSVEPQVSKSVIMKLDQFLRFWPSEATARRDELSAAALVSTWTVGGFKPAGRTAGKALRSVMDDNLDRYRAAADAALKSSQASAS